MHMTTKRDSGFKIMSDRNVLVIIRTGILCIWHIIQSLSYVHNLDSIWPAIIPPTTMAAVQTAYGEIICPFPSARPTLTMPVPAAVSKKPILTRVWCQLVYHVRQIPVNPHPNPKITQPPINFMSIPLCAAFQTQLSPRRGSAASAALFPPEFRLPSE